jgi:hypothetical protein
VVQLAVDGDRAISSGREGPGADTDLHAYWGSDQVAPQAEKNGSLASTMHWDGKRV